MIRSLVRWIMRRSLHRSFRRVCWVGEWPSLPPDRPVVLYANHHYFHDGYLIWLLLHALRRNGIIWMREFNRFPLFRKVGALPFPDDDPLRRATTLRTTIRQMRRDSKSILAYFPEGRLHPPEDDLLAFSNQPLRRLHRLLPAPVWWPVALHVTWWGEPHPTALLTGGTPHDAPTGAERQRLTTLRQRLRTSDVRPRHVLLEAPQSLSQWWRSSLGGD